ncbi:MAG: MBL fold metallo-hydrolase [Nanoarchaeota archaeon]|nr:MBL fold metallo-hydrolase [Nanoarchaeota archaeon]
MSVELEFTGGVDDLISGELGGVQLLINDLERRVKLMVDHGQPPDRYNKYFAFPEQISPFRLISVAKKLGLYNTLEGILRQDLLLAAGQKLVPLDTDALLLTHGHYDHAAGLNLIRPDLETWMHPLTKRMLYSWQMMSGTTRNQFVDVYTNMFTAPKKYGKEKFVSGEEARIPRNIKTFESGVTFKIKDMKVTAYLVDHSLVGAVGYIIETSEGKIAISGDLRLRGRRRRDTEAFFKEAMDADVFFLEGSLMHMEHYGTEDDLVEVVAKLLIEDNLNVLAYPPRELDRILSAYLACRIREKMLVIPPSQAKLLEAFKGIYNFPSLDSKYLGVSMGLRGKGLTESDDDFEDLANIGTRMWERKYMKFPDWSPDKNFWRGKTRVDIKDIKDYKDQFAVFSTKFGLLNLLNDVDAKGGRYIRMHPGPYTSRMEDDAQQVIDILKSFDMYEGPKPDYLCQREKDKRGLFGSNINVPITELHEVHVKGHMNFEEYVEVLKNFKGVVVPYHDMEHELFRKAAPHIKMFIMERNKKYQLRDIIEQAT